MELLQGRRYFKEKLDLLSYENKSEKQKLETARDRVSEAPLSLEQQDLRSEHQRREEISPFDVPDLLCRSGEALGTFFVQIVHELGLDLDQLFQQQHNLFLEILGGKLFRWNL